MALRLDSATRWGLQCTLHLEGAEVAQDLKARGSLHRICCWHLISFPLTFVLSSTKTNLTKLVHRRSQRSQRPFLCTSRKWSPSTGNIHPLSWYCLDLSQKSMEIQTVLFKRNVKIEVNTCPKIIPQNFNSVPPNICKCWDKTQSHLLVI